MPQPRLLLGLVLAVAFLLAASVRAGDKVTITIKDGTQITAEITSQTPAALTLQLPNKPGALIINLSDIQSIAPAKSVAQVYQEKRAQLDPADYEGRFNLAKGLYDQRELVMARQELAALGRVKPTDARIPLLLNAIEEQLKAAPVPAPPPAPATPPQAGVTPSPASAPTVPAAPATDLARPTPEQINLIRVYEYDTRTTSPARVMVPKEVFELLFANYRDTPEVAEVLKSPASEKSFRLKPGSEVLNFLFKIKARDLYPKVFVLDDPTALKTFRTRILQSYVISYCATERCHGGAEAKKHLFLFRNNPWEDASAYANFMILHVYANDHGKMIDRDQPESSLLYQYGLPIRSAKFPHPEVSGWHPAKNKAVQDLIPQWIGKELMPANLLPNGDYPVDYPPGRLSPTPASPADATPDPATPPRLPRPNILPAPAVK